MVKEHPITIVRVISFFFCILYLSYVQNNTDIIYKRIFFSTGQAKSQQAGPHFTVSRTILYVQEYKATIDFPRLYGYHLLAVTHS